MRFRFPLIALALCAVASCASQRTATRPPAPKPAEITGFQWNFTPGVTLTRAESVGVLAHLIAKADHFVRRWRYNWEVSDRYRHTAGYDPTTAPVPGEFAASSRGRGRGGPPGYGEAPPVSVFQMAWPPPPGVDTIQLSAADSLALVSRWRSTVARTFVARRALIHCHPDSDPNSPWVPVNAHVIESGAGRRAICPSWYPVGEKPPWDESRGIDNAILDILLPDLHRHRRELLEELAKGAAVLPGDPWITGQRVRFHLDQFDTTSAVQVAAECKAAAWWCTALTGYLHHIRGNVTASDSIFQAMLPSMPEDLRCKWTDLSPLLELEDRLRYMRYSCERRDSLSADFWWVSDPELGDSINERRAEHFARRVLFELRSGTTYHERWDMRPPGGGLGVEDMIIRYGWPSFAFWYGRAEDISHFGYLNLFDRDSYEHGRFSTAEYSSPRWRFVPSLWAVANPSESRDFDWAVTAGAHAAIYPADTVWWPPEHAERRSGPVVQLWEQHGIFRRQDTVFMALSTTLSGDDFPGASEDSLYGSIFFARDRNSIRRVDGSAMVGTTNVFRAPVSTEPQLVSLELKGDRPAGVLARTRFGINPAPPLNALPRGSVAISAPVFIQPTTPEELPPTSADAAIARMFGSVAYPNPSELGIYWETYGLAESDSVDFEITTVRHHASQSFFQKLGVTLGFSRESASTSIIRWSQIRARTYMRIATAPVPIQGRIMILGTGHLPPGDYTISVTAIRPGMEPVTEKRDFWIY